MATIKGKKNQHLLGTSGDDVIFSGGGTSHIEGGGGNDSYYFKLAGDASVTVGGENSDVFVIAGTYLGDGFSIDGGTSALDNKGAPVTGESGETAPIDARIDIEHRINSTTAISTNSTHYAASPNAADAMRFTRSGDFSNIAFTHIEKIELANGVTVNFNSQQLEAAFDSLDLGAINPGLQFVGVQGGREEKVVIDVEYEARTFYSPYASPSDTAYVIGDFQLDDFSVASIFSNVTPVYDLKSGSETAGDDETPGASVSRYYARVDGANNGEYVYGSNGVDNATMRLGNDVYSGGDGNDLLIGHGGADVLNGDAGDDIFVIGGFGVNGQHSGPPGADNPFQGLTSKADDSNPEWITDDNAFINGVDQYGGKRDVIVGGAGVDVLRATSAQGVDPNGSGVTLKLNDANFKSMEVVQIGGTAGRLNTEDAALQLLNNHYYFRAGAKINDVAKVDYQTDANGDTTGNTGASFDKLIVDASGVTKKGLKFEGNGNANTFVGTTKNDTFIGNGGHDLFTGNAGKDVFVFGKIHEMKVSGETTGAQYYADVAVPLASADSDVVTDFVSGTDKIQLNRDMFAVFQNGNTSLNVAADNLVVAAGATAQDGNDYLLFDPTTQLLKYDADGNGAGEAIDLVVLTGIATLSVNDFIVG